MAGFPDVTERGTSLEQPKYSCGHEAKTDLSVWRNYHYVTYLHYANNNIVFKSQYTETSNKQVYINREFQWAYFFHYWT